ncbi:M14 family zinc carboxypeptidase [Variovorax sp. RT4R15]|uniref:M14 family zinc carboxypeptidase n=1 Tax=Variovorax sp. RT4R15 TaxID=3443737 RepID=UPI003F454CDC
MPYMSVAAIDAAIDHVATTFPALARAIVLPERSVEGRAIKALRIAGGSGAAGVPDSRTGVLFVGGIHARELINPETLVEFALRFCTARANNTGLAFGPKNYSATDVLLAADGLSVVILPMANPDGRNHCLVPGGSPMWRKNRALNTGFTCKGVDLNRNASFLWGSGIGTSADHCNDVFKGPSAFSEPETRNVRWLIDSFPGLACMVDVHSYSELVLYPWGDDQNQTTDPNQNFQNPTFDGQRGTPGNNYKEYIPAADLSAHQAMGNRMRNGIAAVRGRSYTVQQSIDLYPTTGTWHDYAYARKFVETGRRRILGFTLETAREFQPGDAEKNQVISETQAGLMECLFQTLCPAESVQAMSASQSFALQAMREFRDQRMQASAKGQRLDEAYRRNAGELVELLSHNKQVLQVARAALKTASTLAGSEKARAQPMSGKQAAEIGEMFELLLEVGSPALRADIAKALASLGKFEGVALDRLFPVPKRAAAAKPVAQKVAAKKAPAKKAAQTSAARRPRGKG